MRKRETTERDIRRIKRFNYTALAVLAVAAALLLLWWGAFRYWAAFTPAKWLAHPDHRASMTADLLETHPLVGMTAAEVTALLGENDNAAGYFTREDRYVYWLGDRRTLIDSEWLLLDFENGQVATYTMTTD